MNALQKHIEECAFESGVDLDEESAISHEETTGKIESWYQEAAIYHPWRAFEMGLGQGSGATRAEAIADLDRLRKGVR